MNTLRPHLQTVVPARAMAVDCDTRPLGIHACCPRDRHGSRHDGFRSYLKIIFQESSYASPKS